MRRPCYKGHNPLLIQSVHFQQKKTASSAYRIFKSIENVEGQVRSLILMGMAERQRLNDSAFLHFNNAITLAQAHHLINLEIDAKAELGFSYFQMATPEEFGFETRSIETLLKNLAISKNIGYTQGISHSLHYIGHIYLQLGHPGLSLQHLKEALPLASAQRRYEIARIIGSCYKSLNQLDSSEIYYKRSLNEKESSYENKIKAYLQLGDLYMRLGRYEEGYDLFDQSYRMALKVNYNDFIGWTQTNKAKVLRIRKKKEEAIALIEDAKKYMFKINDHIAISMMELDEVEIYKELNRKEEVLKHLLLSLQSARISKNWPRDQFSLTAIVDFYEKEKDYKKAFFYQKEYANSLDSVIKSNAEKARLNIVNLVNENEIEMLNAQKIQAEQDINIKQNTRNVILFFLAVALAVIGAIYWSRHKEIRASLILEEQNHIIREQKRELEYSFNALAKAKTQMIYSGRMASMGQLISGIAHEINNPLNFVSGGMEALKSNQEGLVGIVQSCKNMTDGSLSAMVNQTNLVFAKVQDEIAQVKTIISSLNRFSSPQTGHTNFVAIEPLIGSAITLLNKKIHDNNVTVELRYAKEQKDLTGNPPQLSQIFFNLLDNALNSFAGSGRTRSIIIETIYTHEEAIILFTDTGKGIPLSIQQKVMEAFFSTRLNGIGLGLSISLDLVQKHQGTLTFVSEEGKGSTFRVTIPLQSQVEG